jgi:SAM-dependent methyltransferase
LRKVMFDVWFPEEEHITLNSLKCNNCGFMSYSPRPDENDIKAKYEYLQRLNEDFGGDRDLNKLEREFERQRAQRVRDLVKQHLRQAQLKILDYGGGNGKMMRPFLDDGDKCFLIDYNTQPISDVSRLGNSIGDAKEQAPYDVVLCSHVLEHLSNPRELLESLLPLLSKDGVIYGEVPLEIWTGLPIETEPVTHVNFFTPNSFNLLFQMAGFRLLDLRREFLSYGSSVNEMLWVVACPSAPFKEEKRHCRSDTDEFLYPSRKSIIKRVFCRKGMQFLKRSHLRCKLRIT